MSERNCSTCIFRRNDECHKTPPIRLPRHFVGDGTRTRDEQLIWGWPKIELTDWCGEYK